MKRWLLAALLLPGLAWAQESPPPAPPADAQAAQPQPQAEQKPADETPAKQVPVKPLADEPEIKASKDAVVLDTIEVTAEKRVKAQRDIPGSVGAVRGGELEAMHAQGLKDYIKLIPGVSYPDQGNEETVPVIRGIATDTAFGATSATTGVYLDEMPFGDLFAPRSIPDLNPFDLERVEVLKGPQGTLFGSGALAGAIRYIVKKPDHSLWEAKASETISKTAGSDAYAPVTGVALNAPVFGDRLAFRAAGVFRKEPGLYEMGATDSAGNTIRDDKGADRGQQNSWRVLGDWNATDEFHVSAFWFNQTTHQADFGLTESTTELKSTQFPFASPRNHDFGGGNLTATYDLPWMRVLSSTNRMVKHNWIDQHQEFGFDLQHQQANEYDNALGADTRGWTQEVRLSSPEGAGRLEWLVGGSYLHYGDTAFQYSYIGPDMPDPKSAAEVSDAQKIAAQVFDTTDELATEQAYFGEVTAHLGDRLEFTVGGRKYVTGLNADTIVCGAQIVALFQQQCYPQHFDDRSSGFNPKVSLRYLHDRNIQLYLLASKGFQFGGVQLNPPAPGFPQSAQAAGYTFGPYKSSKLWNYESGVRTEWLDRRLRWDTAFFYMDWKDLQLTIDVPLLGTNVPFGVIANVARAHSEGMETAFDVIPFDGAHWTTTLAFMTARTDVDFDSGNSAGPVKAGSPLPGAPPFQWSSVASYEHAVPYFESWLVNPVITYAYGAASADKIRATGSVGDFATLDARIVLTSPSSRFQPDISLGVNNLTNVRGLTNHLGGKTATTGAAFSFNHFTEPRTTVLAISLHY